MTLKEVRAWLVGLAEAEATLPARVVLERLPEGEIASEESSDPFADMTVEEVGGILKRSPSTVRHWCRTGLLPGAYLLRGKQWRIPRAAVLAFQRAEAEHQANRSTQEPHGPRHVGPVDLGSWREGRAS